MEPLTITIITKPIHTPYLFMTHLSLIDRNPLEFSGDANASEGTVRMSKRRPRGKNLVKH